MSIVVGSNPSATGGSTIWSSLEASASGSQSAQTTNALVGSQNSLTGNGQNAFSGNLTPVIASVQATLDSIVANPALNLSRVLTSPSFAALVSALDGNANGLSSSNSGTDTSTAGSTSASTISPALLIGRTPENTSAASSLSGDNATLSRWMQELDSILQTPAAGNGADGMLGVLSGLGSAASSGSQLAVA